MTDLLYVSYDKDEKRNETGLVVGRVGKNGMTDILKMCLDDDADILYKLLIDQTMIASGCKKEATDR